MAITRLTDVIQPEVFTEYVQQRSTERSALVQSGIIERNAEFDELASGPNTLINMPFWNDLNGDAEIITDTGEFTPSGITSSKDVARKHMRGKAWGANGLSALLSGADPMGAIANLVADYWNRQDQKLLVNTLDGAFSGENMSEKTLDISGEDGNAGILTGETFLDAVQVMGDAKDTVTGVMMHSYVENHLAKRGLIEYIPEAEGNPRVPFFMNKRVIVDDALGFNTEDLIGSVYIFGQGAVAKGLGSHPNIISTETDRNRMSKSGEEFLINRQIQLLHPRGVKWTESSVASDFPTNAEVATGANWERVYEPKQLRIVKFTFRTGTPEV